MAFKLGIRWLIDPMGSLGLDLKLNVSEEDSYIGAIFTFELGKIK